MLAIINTPGGTAPIELREVAEPRPAPNEALLEVRAFSLNRGELRLFQARPEGWRPGQDMVKGRRTEIQFLNGFVARKGDEVGIPTPTNKILTEIVARVEKGELKPDPRHIIDLRLN